MNLPIPSVGLEAGPQYAFDVNSCLTLIDAHDHSPGKGVAVTPAGLNINNTLDMQGNSLINLFNAVFTAQTMATNTLQALSVAPGNETPALQDLWYTDSAGNKVQLTSNGLVNATIASIPGESYAAGTFFWKQGTGSTIPANFDIGSITIRPNVALTSYGVTLSPSAGIASAYTLTLPLIPASNSFVTLDNTGVLNTALPDNSTIQIASGVVSVKTGGITTAQLGDGSVTGVKLGAVWQYADFIANGSVTLPSNVQECFIEGVGGGGGGGSGTRSNAGAGGGGGGGSGVSPLLRRYAATPGEILTVTIGAPGTGGASIAGVAPGLAGTIGGNSTVVSNINGVIFLSGGGPGGGGGNSIADNGGSGPALFNYATLLYVKGGFGGFSGPTGQAGSISTVAPVSSNPGTGFGSFAGGGGGSGYGIGGNGGNGSNASNVPTNGATPLSSSYGAGGGGGGGTNTGIGNPSGAGGNGVHGFVRIMWLGAPP